MKPQTHWLDGLRGLVASGSGHETLDH